MQQLYRNTDMVKAGCHDCEGCSECCRGMGDSVWVDPFDSYLLQKNLHKSFEQLLADGVELHVEDGLLLPNLRMKNEGNHACFFLNEKGRCNIHDFRPGFCRLFPLGRNFEEDTISYFILEAACPMKNKTKVKVAKLLDTPALKEYEHYLVRWHQLTKRMREVLSNPQLEDNERKKMNMLFLQRLYMTEYEDSDNVVFIYEQIEARIEEILKYIK